MHIAACSRSSFASRSGVLTRIVIKHHMQMLSVPERRVNSGSGFPSVALIPACMWFWRNYDESRIGGQAKSPANRSIR